MKSFTKNIFIIKYFVAQNTVYFNKIDDPNKFVRIYEAHRDYTALDNKNRQEYSYCLNGFHNKNSHSPSEGMIK